MQDAHNYKLFLLLCARVKGAGEKGDGEKVNVEKGTEE